ncbi:MAG: tetratricopeptide repeat protein [Myxococcales bacterium]|nr:tetratricopeptide repeat protein [Myxococcales bacterium]
MRATRALLMAAALCLPTAPVAAAPQSTKVARAQALYDLGVQAFKAKDFVKADEFFREAYKLDPSPVLLYNMARAAEEQGEGELAVRRYRLYLKNYPQAEDADQVRKRVRVMEKVLRKAKQGQLTVSGAPPGSRFLVNDEPMPEPGTRGWDLDPGEYAVRVEPTAGEPWEGRATVTTGQLAEVQYAVAGAAGPGLSALTVGKYTAAGAAVVAVGVGALFTARAIDNVDTYNDLTRAMAKPGADVEALQRDRLSAADDRDSNVTLSYVMYGVAGIAAAGAVTLFLLDADQGAEPQAWQLQVGPGAVGLSGRF